MKKLLYISLVLSGVVVLNELFYLGRTGLAWILIILAAAIGLQAIYLIESKK